ncbi:hypothetical protein [Collimonas fungivorans]|uniref:hypothetical protein n=1 Tax=Collimonas fungivorans TaxID=158899 RepID=UPI003FA3B272
MRSLRNLLWFLVGILLVAVPMFSFAASGVSPVYVSWPYGNSTMAGACSYLSSQLGGTYTADTPALSPDHLTLRGHCVGPGGAYDISSVASCADGSAVSTGSDGFPSCGPPPPPPPVDCSSGKPTDFWFDTGPLGNNSKVPTNDGFCGLSAFPKPAISQCYPTATGPTGHVMCHYIGARDGTKAPSDAAPPAPAPSDDTPMPPTPVKVQGDSNGSCPGGTSLVGYDSSNIPMCVGTGTDPGKAPSKVDTTPTQTTNNPDGSTTTKDTTASTNSDGSQTTRTATCTMATNGGKSCTTTTATGKTPTGSQGKNDTDPKTGDDTKGDNPAGLDGELYGKGSKTMQDVMNHWTSAVSGAPFIAAAQTFLGANVNGGSCPSWRADVAYLKMSVNLGQYFCAPGTEVIFSYIGIGVMLGAAYIAFKIAFL